MNSRAVALFSLCIGSFALSSPGGLEAQVPRNLAALANGGHLVFFSSQYDDQSWKADHLLDGSTANGWAAASAGAQSVVIGFRGGSLAEVEDVLINPYTRESPDTWAKEVEVQVSATYPFRDYRSLGRFTLANEGRAQLFPMPGPVEARYVKIRFLGNYGGGYMEAGEVEVMGRLLPAAGPAPGYVELAAEEKGGTVASFSSQYDDQDWAVANLLREDGHRGQWAGTSAAGQEVVLALPGPAAISDVAINNAAREDSSNWAREARIEISASAPYKGFQPVGVIPMAPVGDLHTLTITPPVTGQWVKVFFTANHGGGYMEAGRIRVFTAGGEATASISRQLQETGRAVAREIHFAFDSAEILPESATVLSEIGALLREDGGLRLLIEGHTDSVGGADFNLELSSRRAEAVKTWLVEKAGIDGSRLSTVGLGLSRPVADNGTEEGRALNRRVELVRNTG